MRWSISRIPNGSFITHLSEALPIGLILPITFSLRDGLNTSINGALEALTNAPAIPVVFFHSKCSGISSSLITLLTIILRSGLPTSSISSNTYIFTFKLLSMCSSVMSRLISSFTFSIAALPKYSLVVVVLFSGCNTTAERAVCAFSCPSSCKPSIAEFS